MSRDAAGYGMGCLLMISMAAILAAFIGVLYRTTDPTLKPLIQRCATDKDPPPYCTELIKKITP